MLILTRPSDAAHRTARLVRARGLDVPILFSPVMHIAPLPLAPLPEGTLIFTSENEVEATVGHQSVKGRRAFAVGEQTARSARRHGVDCTAVGGTVDALTDFLISQGGGPYLHLHGRHVRGELVSRLLDAGIAARGHVVYDQKPRPLTDAARNALLGPRATVLPLFSPRSAELVADDLGLMPSNTKVVAFSKQVAQCWPWTQAALVATTKNVTAMLDAITAALASRD